MNIDKQKVLEAGKIASQTKIYARSLIKKDMPLLEIAESIESHIKNLGGSPAFPVNLSINNIAAHYTPSHDDKTLAHGLLKVDIGVHIDGWVADTAFSLDLENSEENKKLISASEKALENALHLATSKTKISLSEIGKTIQDTIEKMNLMPVTNLSGHSIERYDLHSGINVPNVDTKSNIQLEEGLYAVEPFATNGNGKVHDGKFSNIYHLINEKTPRSQTARQLLTFIMENYKNLPFCSRWLVKALGPRALIGLRELESNGNLHHYSQLVEQGKVSQSEQTILVEKDKITITTI